MELPIISNVGWAIISLSFFAGAFNVEIFRAGIEAVADSTKEAAESLGFSRFQTFRYVIFPLAIRVSLPSLNNNLINLVKQPLRLSALLFRNYYINPSPSGMITRQRNIQPCYWFLFYILLVGVLVLSMNTWERNLRIPGYGQ